MDWALIESWKERGVPLHVALRGIEKSFDSYESRPRKRSVKTLLYCQEEVEAQFAEWLESQTGAHHDKGAEENGAGAKVEGGDDGREQAEGASLPFPRATISAHLAECRAAVQRAAERVSSAEAALAEALERAALRLDDLASDFARAARPNAEQLESALTDLEQLLGRALAESLPPAELAARRARAAEQLEPYRRRMERAVYEQTLDHLLAKLLREERGVPRLSLFYL